MPTNPEASEATTPSPTAAQLTEQLNSALSSADSLTAQSMQNFQLVHQARLSRMSRTAANLTAQYGANDPRVVSAEAAVSATTATIGRISVLNQQLTTAAPEVAAAGWAHHGRFYTAQLEPAAKLTVFLVDGQKAYQKQYSFSYTDETGYFLLNYAGAADQSQPNEQLFLEVANQEGKAIYLSPVPFEPVLGTATYKAILLPAGEQPLGDPPQEIRNVAFPSQDNKS